MKKRFLAILLTAAMALPAVAVPVLAEADINAAYEETVTLEVGFEIKTDPNYAEGDDVTNNPWIRSYKERFNIEVVSAFATETSDYPTKVNLAMAEGNLPDVFEADAAQLQQLIEADMIYDMTEVFEKYASDTVKGYMEQDPESFESGKKDGKLYGIATLHWGNIAQFNYVWIRKDWKESLGLADPETMEDVVNIAKAFMSEYGSKGIAVDQTLANLKIIAPAWGAYPEIWVEGENGEIVYGATTPEMKEALTEWASWYQEGILDPDFVTSDTAKINEDTINGKMGVVPFYQWWGYNPGPDVVKNLGSEAIFEAYPIPSATGEEVLHPVKCGNENYLVVSKDCENPEAVMKLVNFYAYMQDESIGKEDDEVIGAHVRNGMSQAAASLRILNPGTELADYITVVEAWEKQDPSMLTSVNQQTKYSGIEAFAVDGNADQTGTYLQQGAEKSAYSVGRQILENNQTINNKMWALVPETINNSGSMLDDILTEGFTKIIMGEESIDYFDTVIENWKAAGGEQATAEMNEMYSN